MVDSFEFCSIYFSLRIIKFYFVVNKCQSDPRFALHAKLVFASFTTIKLQC